MAEILKPNERLVCVGHTALRAPDGSFLPSVPMYIKVGEGQIDAGTGFSSGEKDILEDISGLMAAKFKQYVDGVEGLPA